MLFGCRLLWKCSRTQPSLAMMLLPLSHSSSISVITLGATLEINTNYLVSVLFKFLPTTTYYFIIGISVKFVNITDTPVEPYIKLCFSDSLHFEDPGHNCNFPGPIYLIFSCLDIIHFVYIYIRFHCSPGCSLVFMWNPQLLLVYAVYYFYAPLTLSRNQ